jgi:hypothetical protein
MQFQSKLFQTEKSREEAKMQLKSLQVHPGWKLIKDVLKENIDALAEVILNPEEQNLDEEKEKDRKYLKNLKDKRLLQQALLDLPGDLLKKLDDSPSGNNIEFDPFE